MRPLNRAVIVAASTCVVLGGCATTGTPAQQSAAVHPVDLARLGAVGSEFPTGQVVNPLNGPSALTGSKAAEVGDLVAYGERMTAIPDSCRVLLEPVAASDGVEQASVTSATGPMDPFIAVSAYLPVSVPVAIPDGGCEQFDYEVEGAIPDGTVRRLTAPVIDGAQTYALRTAITVDGVAIAGALVEYFYVAILDGRTFVKIWARVPNEFKAEPALGKLLTRTVSALAGA